MIDQNKEDELKMMLRQWKEFLEKKSKYPQEDLDQADAGGMLYDLNMIRSK